MSAAADGVDLVIVGAGPAGLAAAVTARQAGLSVLVLDEQRAPGGQIYRSIESAEARPAGWMELLGADYAKGRAIVERFRASGAHYRPESAVFDIGADGGLGVLEAGAARWLKARRILIATGAMERPVAVPGWTLPGVMGVGAAQTLLKASAMVPGVRTVIVGSGPLVYLAARQLLAAGADLVALLDTTPRGNYWRTAPLVARAMLAGPELRKGLAWRREVRARVGQFRTAVADLRIEGADAAEAVSFTAAGRPERIACDLVLLHEGVVPNTQLAMAAGVAHDYDTVQACWTPRVDSSGRTSLGHVLIAGDGVRIRGADLAGDAGTLAALAVAADLGVLDHREAERRGAAARARLRRMAPLRRFLDVLYRPRAQVLVPDADETIVCRCEEVTAGELRRVAGLGCPGPNQAKAFTRCGMGPCQGRMCGLAASAILAAAAGRPTAEAGHMRIRPPIKPITVGELAALEGVGAPPDTGPPLPTDGTPA